MNTEDIILKKTFNLLLLKGFDRVSITDIQSETGLSRGLLYHYFKNKEDLFIHVTEKYFIRIFDFDIRKTKDYTVYQFADFLCERFFRITETLESEFKETANVSIRNYHFLFYQVMQRDIIFRNKYQSTIEKELIGWQYAIKNSINAKEINSETDIEFSAKQLFTLTDGIWFQSIFNTKGEHIVLNLNKSLSHYIKLLS